MQVKNMLAALTALALTAVTAVGQSSYFGAPLPVTNITVNGNSTISLKWDDYSDIVGFQLYTTLSLEKPEWKPMTESETDLTRMGADATVFSLTNTVVTVPGDSLTSKQFYRLVAVKGKHKCVEIITVGEGEGKVHYIQVGKDPGVYIEVDGEGNAKKPLTYWKDINDTPRTQVWEDGQDGWSDTLVCLCDGDCECGGDECNFCKYLPPGSIALSDGTIIIAGENNPPDSPKDLGDGTAYVKEGDIIIVPPYYTPYLVPDLDPDDGAIYNPVDKPPQIVTVPGGTVIPMFPITPPFIPVVSISLTSGAQFEVGGSLMLNSSILPLDASNNTIIWSVQNANGTGATITDNILTAPTAGTVVVLATIVDGTAVGTDFTATFNITVTASIPVDPTITWGAVDHTLRIDLEGPNKFKATRLPANYDVRADGLDGKTKYLYFRYINGSDNFRIGTDVAERDFDYNANEAPQDRRLSGFYVGVYPLTVAQFNRIDGAVMPGVSALPKCSITWPTINTANTGILAKLQAGVRGANPLSLANFTVSLPTETQWEYACRAGTRGTYSDGLGAAANQAAAETRLQSIGWFTLNNSPAGIKVVGGKSGNPAGLYDMHGNITEWCHDRYAATYVTDAAAGIDYKGPASGSYRVVRGGNCGNHAYFCRSAHRYERDPVKDNFAIGFRLAAAGAVAP